MTEKRCNIQIFVVTMTEKHCNTNICCYNGWDMFLCLCRLSGRFSRRLSARLSVEKNGSIAISDSNGTIEILEAKYKYTNIQKYKYTNIQIPISDSNDTIEILEAIYKYMYKYTKKNKYTNMQILISDSTQTSHELQPILTFPESHPTSQLWQFQHQFLISICINTFKLFLQCEVERYCHCCEINLTGSFCHCDIGCWTKFLSDPGVPGPIYVSGCLKLNWCDWLMKIPTQY